MSWNTRGLSADLRSNVDPVIAYVGGGLDPFAQLLPQTLILEARSFVHHPLGAGEAVKSAHALRGLATAFAGRWGPSGSSWCRVVVVRVTDAQGNIIPAALTRALDWLRTTSVDVVASAGADVDLERMRGVEHRCGQHGIRLGLLSELTEADFRPPLRLVA